MRIYINELIKAFFRLSTAGVLLGLAVMNGVLLYVNEKNNGEVYTAAQYRQMYDEISGKPVNEVYNNLLKKWQALDEGDGDPAQLELTSDVLEEVKAIFEYDDHLSDIDERARRMTAITLFADPDSFSYKNIKRTPQDFAHLKGSRLQVAPSKGIDMATGFLPTDVIAFLMIMTVIVTIVTREKELSQLALSRTTFKGRAALGFAKLFVCFTAAFVSLILLYSVNFLAAYHTYGFGDLSRQIQSVASFNGSNLKMTVLQYFFCFLASKLLVYCVFAALIYFITALFDSAVKVYSALVLILAGECVLYYTIEPTSYLCPLKYIDLFAFADTKQLYSSYLNLNIFGTPFNYFSVFFISSGLLLFIFSAGAVYFFSTKRVIASRAKRLDINFFKGRHTGLFLHECYKVFIGGKVLLILLAFGAFVYMTYAPVKETFYSKEEIYLKQYLLKYEGELSLEKLAQIDAEEQALDDTDLSGDEITAMLKMQDLVEKRSAYEMFAKRVEHLKASGGEIIYDNGYKLLTGGESAGSKDVTLALTAMTMLICTLTFIYSTEYQTGAAVLLNTSPRGRIAVLIRKLIIGLIIVTIIYLLTYAPYFYSVFQAYGIRKINAPACSMEHLQGFKLSIKAYLILLCVVRYLALIIAMLVIFFISKKAKSFIASLIIETAVLILPLVLCLIGIDVFKWVLIDPIVIGNVIKS